MNRIIKLRAWDKNESLMHDVIVMQRDEFIAVPEIGPDGWELRKRKMSDVDLMQFTGLLDKNGVEVYENDIIEVKDFLGETMGIFTVEYKLNSFSYYAPGKPEQALYFAQNLVEVIGNKFENPELLTN